MAALHPQMVMPLENNYNITVDVAFNTFNNGDFQIELFTNTVLATLDKMMYM